MFDVAGSKINLGANFVTAGGNTENCTLSLQQPFGPIRSIAESLSDAGNQIDQGFKACGNAEVVDWKADDQRLGGVKFGHKPVGNRENLPLCLAPVLGGR